MDDRRVAGALVSWVAQRFGGPVRLAEPLGSDAHGFDSDIYFLHLEGPCLPPEWRRRLVLRVKPSADRMAGALHEAAVQDWLADRSFPVPRVLAVLEPGEVLDRPAQVMERADGQMMLDAVRRAPWRARRHIRRLAQLQARLHTIDPSGFPPGDDLLDARLRLTRMLAEALDDGPLHEGLRRVEQLAHELRDAPAAVCHGDYHPLNVLAAGDDLTVIDWTDAGVGDRHGDVARTLVLYDVASIVASRPAERVALRTVGPALGRVHRRVYGQVLPLDRRRLALWTPVHLLHGWSQARAVHADVVPSGDLHAAPSDRIRPAMVAELGHRFHRALDAVS